MTLKCAVGVQRCNRSGSGSGSEQRQQWTFAPLTTSGTALLTTFRASGEGVATPVSIALDDERAYFVTAADSGKAKRLARDPRVTLAPCTAAGRVVGAEVSGQARHFSGKQTRRRRRHLLRPTRQLFWSYLLYRLRGETMNVYEVVPVTDSPARDEC